MRLLAFSSAFNHILLPPPAKEVVGSVVMELSCTVCDFLAGDQSSILGHIITTEPTVVLAAFNRVMQLKALKKKKKSSVDLELKLLERIEMLNC